MLKNYLDKIIAGKSLNAQEANEAIEIICTSTCHVEQRAAFLTLLHVRGESAQEITGFLSWLRTQLIPFNNHEDALDICGTGGDKSNTFNISSAAAILLASAGVKVAKHGGSAVTSKSGSFEVFTKLDIPVFHDANLSEKMLRETGFVFLLASYFNQGYKLVKSLRQNLKIRTSFNLMGPLLHPANIKKQVLGVYDKKLLPLFAEVLLNSGVQEAIIVNSEDGLDEFSLTALANVAHLKSGVIKYFTINPNDFNLSKAYLSDIAGASPEFNAKIIENIFKGVKNPHRDIVLLNAAPGFLISGLVKNLQDGIALGAKMIDENQAFKYLEKLRAYR